MAITRETILERRQPQLRWSAVFGGAAVAIGIWITLQILGMGFGLTAVDTDDTGSIKAAGIGTGIWTLIAPLIAMFLGGLLAGRLAGTRERKVGGMHGAVMWALALGVGLWMMMSMVSAVAGGVARVGGSAISGAARAGGAIDPSGAMSALGVDTDDLIGPINQRLAREGKPAITARQLDATVRAVAQRGLKEGRMDRQVLVEELARNTALTRQDAQEIAAEFGDRYEALVQQARTKVGDVAQEATDKTGKALMIGGLMMLLSLAAAAAGGALGVRSGKPGGSHDQHARDQAMRDMAARDAAARDLAMREAEVRDRAVVATTPVVSPGPYDPEA